MINIKEISVNINKANILTCGSDDELGSVLIKNGLSHEPIYVYDNKKFLGLISPFHTLFHNSYAYGTQAKHCLVIPPHITSETSIYDVARFMVDLKLYSLPVFDDLGSIDRIVTADYILSRISNDPGLFKEVCDKNRLNTPVTASTHSTIADVYALMREKRIGRVILVDPNGKLKGLLSRRDLQNAFLKMAVKTQYQTKKRAKSHSSLDDVLITHRDEPAFKYATTRVITVPQSEPTESILKKMIRLKLPSVVVANNNIPVGFISRQDILKAFVSLKPAQTVPIIWENSVVNFKELPMDEFYSDVDVFVAEYTKMAPLHNVEIHISKPSKEARRDKPSYCIKLHLHLESGKMLFSTGQNTHIRTAFKVATRNITRQTDISNKQKHYALDSRRLF